MTSGSPTPRTRRDIVRTARHRWTTRKISEFPHLIVNQARVLDYFAEVAAQRPRPHRCPTTASSSSASTVARRGRVPGRGARCAHTAGERAGEERTVRAKYVVGVRRRPQRRARGDRRAARRRRIGRPRLGRHGRARRTPTSPTSAPSARSNPRRATSCSSRARAATSSACTSTSARSPQDDNGAVRKTPIDEIIAQGERDPAPLLAST